MKLCLCEDHRQYTFVVLDPFAEDLQGGLLLPVMLLISIALGFLPLAGVVWIVVVGSVTTVDGLFMSLILLTLSGIFFLNAFWELRDRGFLGKSKTTSPKSAVTPKSE